MADSDSDNEAQSNIESSYTNAIGAFAASIIPKINPNLDPVAHKSQKFCKICGLKVKNTHLLVKNKRYNCKFCHNAVCENCSNIRCYHMGKGGVQRICHGCFYEAIEGKFKEESREEIEKFTQIALEEKRQAESELNRIEGLLIFLKRSVSSKKKKLLKVNEKLEMLISISEDTPVIVQAENKEIIELQSLVNYASDELEKVKEVVMGQSQELNELQTAVVKCDLDISDLTAELEYTKNTRRVSALSKKQREAQNLEILKNQIISHSGVVSTLKHDIQTLKKQISETKTGSDCIIQ